MGVLRISLPRVIRAALARLLSWQSEKEPGRVVVTHEQPAPDARRKVPIPNVCQAFNVPLVDTFEMLRTLGVQVA